MKIFTFQITFLTRLFGCVFFVFPSLLFAQGYTLQDADVEVDVNGYITSCSYDYSNKDIIIPSTLDATTIVGIAASVFEQKDITSVTLPSTIESVGSQAFYSNKITSVTFENNSHLRIVEALAFSNNTSLSSITLPTNSNAGFVKYFNERGEFFNAGDIITNFYRKYSAQIPYTLTDADVTITDGVITACNYDFSYSDIIIPSDLNSQTVIGIGEGSGSSGVFAKNSITSVDIPSTIKTIGKYAFYDNDIVEVTIAANSNLQTIGERAFYWNSYLSQITLPTNAATSFTHYQDENGIQYNPGDQIIDFVLTYHAIAPYTLTDDDVVVTDGYIQSCSYSFDSKSIIIPASLDEQTVKGVADYSYYGSKVFYDKGIVSITFPNTLEYIGSNSFSLNSLFELELPASLKTLKGMAFYSNDLTKVGFAAPSNIEVIEGNAFYSNTGVEINLPGSHVLGENVVYKDEDGVVLNTEDVVPDKSKTITASIANDVNKEPVWQNIEVQPNPTSGAITIRSNMVIKGIVEIYSMTGTMVKVIEVNNSITNTSIADLSSGIYLFKYEGNVVAKIVKK